MIVQTPQQKYMMDILDVYNKFEELRQNVKDVVEDVQNKGIQNTFINNIADVIEYTVSINNYSFSKQILEFLIDTFITIGELEYDMVENVLDALTASRVIINRLINNNI